MSALSCSALAVPLRLKPTTVEIPRGALVGVVGPNGSGKSTFLQAAAGLLPEASGEVRWGNDNPFSLSPLERARRTAWVPQEAHFEFGFTVRSVVAQGRYAHGDDEAPLAGLLEEFDLTELAERPVTQLSGGERQRVLLARAAATAAPLQLWDEPLAPLDPRHGLQLLVLAQRRAESGATVVLSLHDLRLAHCLSFLLVFARGELRAAGRPEAVLTASLLREVFGVESSLAPSLTLRLP